MTKKKKIKKTDYSVNLKTTVIAFGIIYKKGLNKDITKEEYEVLKKYE